MQKKELRDRFKEILKSMNAEEKMNISLGISKNLSDLFQILNSKKLIVNGSVIAGYSPLPDEFNWYLEDGLQLFRFCLPHIVSKSEMEFYEFELCEIKKKFQGLRLDLNKNEVKRTDALDLFIIPGLAFSKNFKRLGRGNAYYDRYLSHRLKSFKVGVCSEKQLIEDLPSEEHDIEMDYIITEKKIYSRRGT